MDISQIIIGLNIAFVCIAVFFVHRILRASSLYNWNPGDSDIQLAQRIIILKSIVAIACVAIIAAILNVALS